MRRDLSVPTRRMLAAILCLGLPFGCRGASETFMPAVAVRVQEPAAQRAPEPSRPELALELLEWSWDHRSYDRYRELFTDDYRAICDDPTSPAMHREDELYAGRHWFDAARHVRFEFIDRLLAVPDQRPGKDPTWHRQVTAGTSLRLRTLTDESFAVDERVRFYVVRGDSAVIPIELRAEGFAPDTNRWYIERWESLGPIASPATHPRATHTTWCALKRSAP